MMCEGCFETIHSPGDLRILVFKNGASARYCPLCYVKATEYLANEARRENVDKVEKAVDDAWERNR